MTADPTADTTMGSGATCAMTQERDIDRVRGYGRSPESVERFFASLLTEGSGSDTDSGDSTDDVRTWLVPFEDVEHLFANTGWRGDFAGSCDDGLNVPEGLTPAGMASAIDREERWGRERLAWLRFMAAVSRKEAAVG